MDSNENNGKVVNSDKDLLLLYQFPSEKVVEEKTRNNEIVEITKYLIGRELGSGAFAKVYEFTRLHDSKKSAVKILSKEELGHRLKNRIIAEIGIQKHLNHPNLLKLEHFFEDTKNIYILLELCPKESLKELLSRRGSLTEIEVKCIGLKIINILCYLKSMNILHRDIKLENLFLTEDLELKMGDFGAAIRLKDERERRYSLIGTPNYMAPEIIDKNESYSFEVDTWSFAVVLYFLIYGYAPFESQDTNLTYKKIQGCIYDFNEEVQVSESFKDLIRKIFLRDPKKRLKLKEILAHDFFEGNGLDLTCEETILKSFRSNHSSKIPLILPQTLFNRPPSPSYSNISYTPREDEKQSSNSLPKIDSGSNCECKEESEVNLIVEDINGEDTEGNGETHLNALNDEKYLSNLHAETHVPVSLMSDKIQGPKVYLTKFSDEPSFGLGYLLNTKILGAYFNDYSSIISKVDSDTFIYIHQDEKTLTEKHEKYNFSKKDYPETLSKKVVLLNYFSTKLQTTMLTINSHNEEPSTLGNNYIRRWLKSKHAILFKLNNDTVHVFFSDNTQVILSASPRVGTYVNEQNSRQHFFITNDLQKDKKLAKKINYIKEMLKFSSSKILK